MSEPRSPLRHAGAVVPLVALVVLVMLASAFSSAPALEIGRQVPAIGPAFPKSFSVECGASATLIHPGGGLSMISYECQTPASGETGGTVLVAVGSSDIADPALATRNSEVFSGDTVRAFGGNVKYEYCRADTGTVKVFCRALVERAP